MTLHLTSRPEKLVIELKERKTIISASLLAADFSALGRDCERAAEAGCDWLHFDIMDGLFVPSISFGDPVLECVGKISRLPVDVHMMVTEPVRYAERYAGFGASGITVHVEACNDVKETLNEIKRLGMRAGISLKPATPASAVLPYLPYADMVLVMTVEPGFGGQEFMPDMLSKINEIRRHADEHGYDTDIQVDGGINGTTAALVRQAGANVLVSGSYLFKAQDMAAAVDSLK